MNLFQNAKFFTTVNHLKDLPDTPLEIAFVGRSNAGKSSAINTLTNHVRLAYVSKTPGRTQHINFFELQNGNFLVDLPGYGYAQVPEAIRTRWVKLLGDYLQQRKQLIGLILIMDARHPLKELDIRMLDFSTPQADRFTSCFQKPTSYPKTNRLKPCPKLKNCSSPTLKGRTSAYSCFPA